MSTRPLLIMAMLSAAVASAPGANGPVAAVPLRQPAEELTFPVTFTYRYLLQLPDGYGADARERWPLVVFLHGIGERGTNVQAVAKHGPPKLVEAGQKFPFILVSPQCPPDDRWNAAAVDSFVALIAQKFRVDPDRIYLTGLSMGGFGAWAVSQKNPDRYAAVIPICGGGDPRLASRLCNVPIWVFHGAKDPTVPLAESERMVAAIKQAGGQPRFTVYPEALHDSWTESYANPELWSWLLEQKRSAR